MYTHNGTPWDLSTTRRYYVQVEPELMQRAWLIRESRRSSVALSEVAPAAVVPAPERRGRGWFVNIALVPLGLGLLTAGARWGLKLTPMGCKRPARFECDDGRGQAR